MNAVAAHNASCGDQAARQPCCVWGHKLVSVSMACLRMPCLRMPIGACQGVVSWGHSMHDCW
jgi:hypothetical protein